MAKDLTEPTGHHEQQQDLKQENQKMVLTQIMSMRKHTRITSGGLVFAYAFFIR